LKRRLVLFDIDGTLLDAASAGRRALRDAFAPDFSDLAFFNTVPFSGKTDPQIITELYVAAGAADRATPANVDAMVTRYVSHLERHVADASRPVLACPGIGDLLTALHGHADVVVGLLTGNVIPGARLKLTAAGLDFDDFRLGAFGSDSAHRPDLPPIAARRAMPFFGRVPTGEEVVIIGDTPADVTCGNSINARAIGVGTGPYSRHDLAGAGAYAAFDTLADTAATLAAILA
jgi:phosphoglycolate phosphatase-like HAD superfamily hydrolase